MPVFCFVWKNNDNTIRGKQYFLQLHLHFPHLVWSPSVDLALLLLQTSAAQGRVGSSQEGWGARSQGCPDLQQTDSTGHRRVSQRPTRQVNRDSASHGEGGGVQ